MKDTVQKHTPQVLPSTGPPIIHKYTVYCICCLMNMGVARGIAKVPQSMTNDLCNG